jgi:glycine/D-amino acid oxidase-like deaminating enzyme
MSGRPLDTWRDTADIAVVGAGIIGVASALALARQGRNVLVIDAQGPGLGASYGNAGHLATEQVFPIADLSILKRLPGMLMDPMGPLRMDWKYLPHALPWLIRLLLNLRPAPYQRTVAGLRALNEHSMEAWRRLLGGIGRLDLLKEDGSLLVFERGESRQAVDTLHASMARQQVPVDRWQARAVRDAAPRLSERILGGLFFPATAHVVDPYRVVRALVDSTHAAGVRFCEGEVVKAEMRNDGVVLRTSQGGIKASQVLIACGAHSAPLTRQLTGKRIPLDTERGYHLMLPKEHGRLPFAVTSLERRFIMTPMADGLRLAGTVEFAGLQRPPNMARAWQLRHLSKGLFREELDAEGASPWMGFRPSLPDSLPIIDRACDGRVLLAFGHQHLGLTQAAITAQWIADLARPDSRKQPLLEPYRLERF